MSRMAALCVAGVLGAAAVAAVSSGPSESHPVPVGRSPDAKPLTAREQVRAFRRGPAEAVRRGGIDAREVLSVLEGPADSLPDWVSAPERTHLEGGAARRLPVARGVSRMWIVTDRSGILVALAADHRTSWFLGSDIAAGRVLSLDLGLHGDPARGAITGVLPDGTTAATLETSRGPRTVRLVDGIYSERFALTRAALPRTLRFTDARGTHELRLPRPRLPRP